MSSLEGGGIDDKKVVIVTDPPFNIGFKYNTYKDKMSDDDYYKLLNHVFTTKDIPFICIHYPENLHRLSIETKVVPQKVVSWVYSTNMKKHHRDIAYYKIQPDLTKIRQPRKDYKDKRNWKFVKKGNIGSDVYDWWKVTQVKNTSKEKTEHPCQMPLDVMRRIIASIPEDYIIFDPFAGSGSTLIAAKEFGRNYIGCEIDSKYYSIAKSRLEETVENSFSIPYHVEFTKEHMKAIEQIMNYEE